MRPIRKLIVHCSDSAFGDAATIRLWHTSPDPRDPTKPWRDIGYHYVILNGARQNDSFDESLDGVVETGRPIEQVGAHCFGDNYDSIGICLIGKTIFSDEQLNALVKLLVDLRKEYKNPEIWGHCERPSGKSQGKTCPNLDVDTIRQNVAETEKGVPDV